MDRKKNLNEKQPSMVGELKVGTRAYAWQYNHF